MFLEYDAHVSRIYKRVCKMIKCYHCVRALAKREPFPSRIHQDTSATFSFRFNRYGWEIVSTRSNSCEKDGLPEGLKRRNCIFPNL